MTGAGKICVIYTGGTLGMVPSERGYVPSKNLGRLMTARMPELAADAVPGYELIEYDPPIDSANATPESWYELAERVSGLRDGYDGFVIVHGTDTLAYTASALSFLLARFERPVVFTGSQIPLHEVRNDAQGNLLTAMIVAGLGRSKEVGICFGRRLLRANRTTKIRTTALDAFDSPNCPALAELGTEIEFREVGGPLPGVPVDWLAPPAYRPAKVVVLPFFPGIEADLVRAVTGTGVQGLVLECYGRGTAPSGNAHLLRAVRAAIDGGVTVVAISQCLQGGAALGAYAAGSALADCGVVSGFDMTREAAATKLHSLFARGLPAGEIARRMQENLRGELTPMAA